MLSFPHLIVLFIVVLVIFGPQKLPELARLLGKATADFRRMTADFRITLEDEIRDLDRQARLREWEIAHPNNPIQALGTTPRALPESGATAPVAAPAEATTPAEASADKPAEPATHEAPLQTAQPSHASPDPVPAVSDFPTSTGEKPSDDNPAV